MTGPRETAADDEDDVEDQERKVIKINRENRNVEKLEEGRQRTEKKSLKKSQMLLKKGKRWPTEKQGIKQGYTKNEEKILRKNGKGKKRDRRGKKH